MSGFDFKIDPLENFESLFTDALNKNLPEPNAMALATVNSEKKPSVRTVLYRGLIRDGFSFYTNYQSRKALDIETNPIVCANFFWAQLERQIRIEGQAQKTTRAESEAYFKTRPRISQIGAWASDQSRPLASLESLEVKFKNIENKYSNQDIPCPPHWGGFLIIPEIIEFWFGRAGRLHERYQYTRSANGWSRLFLNP